MAGSSTARRLTTVEPTCRRFGHGQVKYEAERVEAVLRRAGERLLAQRG